MSENMKKCFEGCLIGGAVGDALGYPVEFLREREIILEYGEKGICRLEEAGDPAVVSDDTQMTLFAAHALIYSLENPKSDWKQLIRRAYRDWFATQVGDDDLLIDGKPLLKIYGERCLHERRAPGNTCLGSIGNYIQNPMTEFAENNSKGCGTVMRAAPYGLVGTDAGDRAYMMSRYDAMLTHGHEDAWKASATLASIIFKIVHHSDENKEKKLSDVIGGSLGLWNEESCVRKAVTLAEDRNITDIDAIHHLGEGWVADEALAIAIFCAIRYDGDFSKAIRAAVNHNGDSDSTGAICGNILGAWLGIDAVKKAFDLKYLEMHKLIMKTADELFSLSKEKNRLQAVQSTEKTF